MAKIKQVKKRLDINPDRSYQETVVNICYDSTDRRTETYRRHIPQQRFYIRLPQVVADALGVTDVRGDNQVDVMERFDEAIERFKKLKTEVSRVILYKFEVEPLPEGHPKRKEYHHSSNQNLQVRVWAGTYEETVCIAGDGARRYSYEHIESDLLYPGQDYSGPEQHRDGRRFNHQLPWTKQNEAFFQWIMASMTKLVDALAELYEPDKLIETISAGRLLPLGNQPTK